MVAIFDWLQSLIGCNLLASQCNPAQLRCSKGQPCTTTLFKRATLHNFVVLENRSRSLRHGLYLHLFLSVICKNKQLIANNAKRVGINSLYRLKPIQKDNTKTCRHSLSTFVDLSTFVFFFDEALGACSQGSDRRPLPTCTISARKLRKKKQAASPAQHNRVVQGCNRRLLPACFAGRLGRRKKMERWLSGRKRLIANPLYDILRTEGSNPSLSEISYKAPSTCFFFTKLPCTNSASW